MPIRPPRQPQYITHKDAWDTLLVRIGHHLWRWHKQEPRNQALIDSLEAVWAVKREFRKHLAQARERSRVLGRQMAAQNLNRRARKEP